MPVGPEPTRAESEASEWLVLLDSPAVPQHEIERFQAWLGASEENKRAWASVSQTWDKLGPILASLPPEAIAPRAARAADNDNVDPGARAQKLARLAAPIGIVAAVAAVVLFAPLAPNTAPPLPHTVSYATQARDARTLSLEDGSTIELSPLAEARVAFSERERRVELDRGTAMFDVAADADRPFIVATPFGEVRVVGTAFAVRVGEESATTSVVRGVVEGAPARGATLWARMTSSPASVTARADEEIRLARGEAQLLELDAAEVERRLAWREGKVAADNVSLREAAEEVTRFSGVTFEFADQRLARERVTLFIDGSDVGEFLTLLETNLGVRAERVAVDRVRLSRRS
ncbi:MAG: histidine kinase [Alphaproteobacteria bacterium]|nr:MAG: histidine kinase [Alphaproteobacteria bacterium]